MTVLRLFNFLTRKKEVFRPLRRNVVGFYACGPTVYNYAHIGNLRTYIFEDVLRRTLEYAGYKVKHVMNITDVDDKIIKGANATGKNIHTFSEPYKKAFFEDIKKLNILPAWKYPEATKHIKEMAALILKLLKSKLAYKAEGSVYFDVSKFKNYGKLSGLKKRELKIGARVDADEYEKNAGEDFVLWKAKKTAEPNWPARFAGEARPLWGRPGWHIECSAMSMKYLGASFDIHAGGVDLLFPHHENEIAQSESSTGHLFVKYWLHNEWLLVDGKKMAKSAGNFYTLRNIIDKGFSPLDFRYLTLQNHYRTPLNFTWISLKAAQGALNRLENIFLELGDKTGEINKNYRRKFMEAMDNDLETPLGLALVWNLLKEESIKPEDKKATLLDFDKVLGLGLEEIKPVTIPVEVKKLINERESVRESGDFKKSDELRNQIKDLGFEIKDTSTGVKVSKLK